MDTTLPPGRLRPRNQGGLRYSPLGDALASESRSPRPGKIAQMSRSDAAGSRWPFSWRISSSPIVSAATKAGVPFNIVKPGEALPDQSAVALLDLQYPGDWEGLTRRMVEAGGEVIAFGPHIDGPLMKRARAAGCGRVMAKSKFVHEVPKIMAQLSNHAE